MRTLNFIVDGQILKQDPSCDFSGLVPGTKGYLQADISFSPEWNGCVKVAAFYSPFGKEFEPQVLKDGHTCMIPEEVLKLRSFKMKVIARCGDAKTMTTNKITITQGGGQ